MNQERINYLIEQQQAGRLSRIEQTEWDALLEELWQQQDQIPGMTAAETEAIYRQVIAHPQAKPVKRLWPRIAAAASILVILSAGGYFLLKPKPLQPTAQLIQNDIAPGHNQATLTLANGQKIVLTKGLKGQLAIQGSSVIQASGHDIAYNSQSNNEQVSYNTLATARGEQSPYPLVLADGTRIWLNAASSVTFPTAFNGKDRTVKLTGEAYFEVVHNAGQPFKVTVNGQTIEDIGTKFDIKAYQDEPVSRTTLMEGIVAVANNNQRVILKPGEQAVLSADRLTVANADLEAALAWKNELFHFSGSDIRTVMREFARWYDVDVAYRGQLPASHFEGEISRKVKASEVFGALKRYHLQFKVDGKKVIISPQEKTQ